MTETTVAQLDRGSNELHEALSRATGFWDDSRRESTALRYLLPHGEAHDRLHAQLISVLTDSIQARDATRDADLAVAAARKEYDQARAHIADSGSRLADTRMATEAALGAERAGAHVYANALRLVGEANSTAP